MERYFELAEKTPYSDAVHANYQPNEEHIQERNYKLELELRKLKHGLTPKQFYLYYKCIRQTG